MPEAAIPVYLVDADSDPVVVRIEGRACFQNSVCLREFIGKMLDAGKGRFVLDFAHCTGMDSTFLGVLAGAALDQRRRAPAGSVVLAKLGPRNLELVRNLGLHRLLTVEAGNTPLNFNAAAALECAGPASEREQAKLVLEAHELLCTVEESNRAKFQDVMAFLRDRVAQK